MLHALVRPFFHVDSKRNLAVEPSKALFRSDQLPRPNLLRRLFHLLRFGAINEAVQIVRECYLAVGQSIVMPPGDLVANGELIAAALLIPMNERDIEHGLKRWLQPPRYL